MRNLENLAQSAEENITQVTSSEEEVRRTEVVTERQNNEINSSIQNFLREQQINPDSIAELNSLEPEEKGFLMDLLVQTKANNIIENARNKHKSDMAQSSKATRFLKGVVKKFSIARLEKEEAIRPQVTAETVRNFAKTIQTLKEREIKVKEISVQGSDGKTYKKNLLEFNSAPEGASAETKRIYDAYNNAANALIRTPADWVHGTKEEQERIEKVQNNLETARGVLLSEMSKLSDAEKAGKTAEEIEKLEKQKTIEVSTRLLEESAVQGMVQSYFNYPDAVEKIKNLKNQSWFWGTIGKTLSVSRLKQAGAGASIRLGIKAIGVASGTGAWWGGLGGAGIAGGVLGFWRGKKTAKENIINQDWEARRQNLGKGQPKNVNERSKNFVSSEQLAKRLKHLTEKAQNETDPRKQEILVSELEARLKYIKTKLDEQKVTLGDKNTRAKNQLALVGAIGLASAYLLANKNEELNQEINKLNQKRDERLERILDSKEKKIEEKRKKWVRNQAIKGATYGALFGVAGYMIADAIHGSPDTESGDGGEFEPTPNPEPVVETPTYKEVSVPVSSRGSMQTFDDLREALKEAGYKPGDPNNPSAVNFIFEHKNADLSKSVGYFRPDQVAESHMGHPGDEYRITSDGRLVFFDKSAGTEVTLAGETNDSFYVSPDENAEMFDSGAHHEVDDNIDGNESEKLTEQESGGLEDASDTDTVETGGDGTLTDASNKSVEDNLNKNNGRINPDTVLSNRGDGIVGQDSSTGSTIEDQFKKNNPMYNSGPGGKVSTLDMTQHRLNAGEYENASVPGVIDTHRLSGAITEDFKFFDENQLTQGQVDQWKILSDKIYSKSGGRWNSFRDVYDHMPKWKQHRIDKIMAEYSGFEQNQKILEWFAWEQKTGAGKFFGRLFGTGPGKNLHIDINSNYPGGGNGPIYPGGGNGPRVSSLK